MGQKQQRHHQVRMSDKHDTRFYVANVAAAALLVSGICNLASGITSRAASKEEDKAGKKETGCPLGDLGHNFAQATGTISVAASVAMIDRLPFAGLFGVLAALAPMSHSETRAAACPAMSFVALADCAYLFFTKEGRFA